MIHMQQNFEGIQVLYSGANSFEDMKMLPVKRIFDKEVCSFLDLLASEIRKDTEARQFPDIMTFGFFCRKANISKLKTDYEDSLRIGRGFSFHVAPSNVPINLAYTLVAGLLSGNACVARASSKDFLQTAVLCRLLEQTADKMKGDVGKYIAIVRYRRNKEINDYFSGLSNIRVIWGGDHTVKEIRKSEISARCVEITFADRYSICVLYAHEVLRVSNWEAAAQNFYNDTYLYDQNACSSPRLLYWIGSEEEAEEARQLFWNKVHEYVAPRYLIEPITAVDKLAEDCRLAIELDHVQLEKGKDNLFHRIRLNTLGDQDITKYRCPGGSFLEYQSESIDDLKKVINAKYQTLSYLGANGKTLARWAADQGLQGIDRVVPMGRTAEFTLTWDGYDLIDSMSRKLYSA